MAFNIFVRCPDTAENKYYLKIKIVADSLDDAMVQIEAMAKKQWPDEKARIWPELVS